MKLNYQYLLQPVILLLFPIAFLYNRNIQRVNLQDALLPMAISLCFGLMAGGIIFLIRHKVDALFCLVSSWVFVGFGTYGTIFQILQRQHLFSVEHYNFLPLFLVASGYLIWALTKTGEQTRIQMAAAALYISGGLLLFNLVPAGISEISSAFLGRSRPETVQALTENPGTDHPDIYYIVMDEYASFQTIKQYFGFDNEAFKQYLISQDFFVAENSQGLSTTTRVEIASRLNFRSYLENEDEWNFLHGEIGNNKTVQLLKGLGYTSIVIDTVNINADQFADISLSRSNQRVSNLGLGEFATVYIQSSVLNPVWDILRQRGDPGDMIIRQSVIDAIENVVHLKDYDQPIFVYIHLNLPHHPFVFTENGLPVSSQHRLDFNYYLDQYKYATTTAKRMIDAVLRRADPENPPIILLQSDHGVRPFVEGNNPEKVANFYIKDFPPSEKIKILNALYLPGFEYSTLAEDLDPIAIFPMIFQEYFSIDVNYP